MKKNRKQTRKKRLLFHLFAFSLFALFAVLYFLPVRLTASVAAKQLYQYEDLRPEDLCVEAKSLLGRTYRVTEFELKGTDLNEVCNTVQLKNLLLQTELTVPVFPLTGIECLYDEQAVYVGKNIDLSKIHVAYIYEDGHRVEKGSFAMPGKPEYVTGSDYRIVTQVDGMELESVLKLNIIPVKRVEPHAKYGWFTGDEADPDGYTVFYADGAEEQVDATEIRVVSEDKNIQNGDNIFEIATMTLSIRSKYTG